MKRMRYFISGGVICIALFLSNGICGNSCDVAPVDSGFGAPGTYRFFDAMAEYVFNNNQAARTVALGNGSKEQTYMGDWSANRLVKPCTVTDNPRPMHSQYEYLWSWDNKLNPRKNAYNPADSTVIKVRKRIKEPKGK